MSQNLIEEEEDASQGRLGPDLTGTPCLFTSEIAFLLEKQKNEGAKVSEAHEKTLEYAQRFSKFKSKECVRQVRNMLADLAAVGGDESMKLQEFEIAALCNLCPEHVEEAHALIPTLKRYEDEDLQKILNDMANYRKFT